MKTILLTEDDPFLADIYTTKFKEAGFNVEVAVDGKECLRRLGEVHPDLLVLDIVLPQTEGWEVLRQIRNNEAFKNMKVVILSNLSQKLEIDKGLSFGVVRYFIKAHYTPSEVVEQIKEILK